MDQAENLRMLIKKNFSSVSKKTPRIIAVTSGKGGVGKTNLVIGLATALSNLKKRVIILDADLGLSNIDVLLGIVPKYNLHHVIRGEKKINDIIMETPEGFKIIPAASGIEKLANLLPLQREELIFQLNSLRENADVLLIDTPAGISNNTIDFLFASQEVIVISTPEPTAITDAYAIIKIISKKNRDIKIWIMINMANSEEEAKEIARRIILTSKHFLNVSVHSLGFLPKDRCISEAVKRQSSFNILYPYSRASRTTTLLAKRLYD